jgi:hypothetical protein
MSHPARRGHKTAQIMKSLILPVFSVLDIVIPDIKRREVYASWRNPLHPILQKF